MKKNIVNTLKYTLFIGIGLLLMYLAFRNIDLDRMLSDLKQANYFWVGLSLVFSVVAYASRAYRWGMLIEPLGVRPKFSNLFYSLSVGYFANLALPRLGEVTRCTALYEVEKTSLDSLMGTVLAERVIDVICLLTLIIATIFVNVDQFTSFFMENVFKDKMEGLKHISYLKIALLVLVFIVIVYIIYKTRDRWMKIGIAAKVGNFIKGLGDGLKTVLQLKNRMWFIFHTVLIWGMYYVSGYVCFYSLPETAAVAGPAAALFILVLGGLGMSAPVQGGIGAYHFLVEKGMIFLGVLITTDAVTGKAISKGLVFATIVHSSQVLLMVFLGSMSIIMLNIVKRKQLKQHEQA